MPNSTKSTPLRASDVNSVTEAIRAAQVVFEEDGSRLFPLFFLSSPAGKKGHPTFNGESSYWVYIYIHILGT